MVVAIPDGAGEKRATGPRLRAALRHVVGFWTWRSLSVEGQLSTREVVGLAATFVLAARDEA